jgi:hypothetical protein
MNDIKAAKELIELAGVVDGTASSRVAAAAPSIRFMMMIQSRIEGLATDLGRWTQWSGDEISDLELGKDMDALRQHLDNASGRCSTCIQELRRINK